MISDVLFIIGLPLMGLALVGLMLTKDLRRAARDARYEAWRQRWH